MSRNSLCGRLAMLPDIFGVKNKVCSGGKINKTNVFCAV